MKYVDLQPQEVWYFAETNREDLECEDYEIAAETEDDVSITIYYSAGDLRLGVWKDGSLRETHTLRNEAECTEKVESLYAMYLYGEDDVAPVEDSEDEQETIIETREAELFDWTQDYILTALDGYPDEDIDELTQRVEEAFLGFLGEVLGLDVYRPKYIEQDGKTTLVEYPYKKA